MTGRQAEPCGGNNACPDQAAGFFFFAFDLGQSFGAATRNRPRASLRVRRPAG